MKRITTNLFAFWFIFTFGIAFNIATLFLFNSDHITFAGITFVYIITLGINIGVYVALKDIAKDISTFIVKKELTKKEYVIK